MTFALSVIPHESAEYRYLGSSSLSGGRSATNLAFTIVAFATHLLFYDSAGSVNPDWLEWLG